ncbi:UNVERIFIED_CONTAM: hypothetical protein PYX00_006024 [Menopon gallinae]|uniref:Gustatory receptor n=1 Tax=Menopon gallinae TaxID=328185 RepID=A0AAW2HUC3_9NEOP
MPSLEAFALSFFGFFDRDRPALATALCCSHALVLLLTRTILCPFEAENFRAETSFKYVFLLVENYVYGTSVVFGLIIVRVRRERISSVLANVRKLSAEVRGRGRRSEPIRMWHWLALHFCASLLSRSLCLVGLTQCILCTSAAVIVDFHTFMMCFLVSAIVIQKTRLMSDINTMVTGSTKDGDRTSLRSLSSLHQSFCDLAEEFNSCFAEINLVLLLQEFVTFVTAVLNIINGSMPMDAVCWFLTYCVNSVMKIVFFGKLYEEADKTATCLHTLFIESDDQQVREEVSFFIIYRLLSAPG